MAGDDEKCRKAGCDGYATKPVDRTKLLATIAQYASERRQPTDDDGNNTADLTANDEQQTLTRTVGLE